MVARATQFFKEEGVQCEAEKLAVFAKLEGRSTRQAEAVFAVQSSKPVATKTLKVELSAEDYASLEKLQGLLSHRGQGKAGTLAGVLALLFEEGLEKHDPVRIEARSERRRAAILGAPQMMSTAMGKGRVTRPRPDIYMNVRPGAGTPLLVMIVKRALHRLGTSLRRSNAACGSGTEAMH